MIRVLRSDYSIETISSGQLALKSRKIERAVFPIQSVEAVYLSLFDGTRDDDDVARIAFELFGENSNKLTSVARFLLPLEISQRIFGHANNPYYPEQFMTRRYNAQYKNEDYANIPKYMTLRLTHKCLRQCIYCYEESEFAESVETHTMSFETIRLLLDQAFDLAIGEVLLTGGEPMMHPYAYDIIDYLGQHGMHVKVLTKHRLDEARLSNINTSTLDLYLSMDTYKPEIANWLTGTPTYFDDMLSNVHLLNRIGIPFQTTAVVSQKTASDILDTVRFLLDLGARHVYTGHYNCDDKTKIVKELYINEDERLAFDEKWLSCIHENNLGGSVFHKSQPDCVCKDLEHAVCDGLSSKITVNYNGDYILCDHLIGAELGLSNVYKQDFLEHWMSAAMNQLRYPNSTQFRSTVCDGCDKFDRCTAKNSCYARSIAQHHMMYRPVEEVEYACR